MKMGVIEGHKISWWVWAGNVKIPRTSHMRGTWGYDATCSCGWKTRSGGAVKQYIQKEIYWHKLEAKIEQENLIQAS